MKDRGQKVHGEINAIISSALDGVEYDRISSITYVSSGNGVGEIETVVYALGATTVLTLTLSYDASNRIISIIPS